MTKVQVRKRTAGRGRGRPRRETTTPRNPVSVVPCKMPEALVRALDQEVEHLRDEQPFALPSRSSLIRRAAWAAIEARLHEREPRGA